jgi:23S rRNA (cytosine1962-C5)-methyltransferase
MIKALAPENWKDYELIDCGEFEKLERFGPYFLIRPEPQAVWKKVYPEQEWNKLAHARFRREKQKASWRSGDSENGGWQMYKPMPETWNITYPLASGVITMRLALTSFGHIGVFPEQAENWNYIVRAIRSLNQPAPKVLNLFAYTGGASLAARSAGADTTHLDAVKQVVSWSRENMELSGLSNIRWLVEDAMKYLRREVKRGKTYQGIILDPPAYGRGPTGEKWVLEEGITELMELCSQILAPQNSFLILNLYSLGFSSLIANNLAENFKPYIDKEFGEFYLPARSGVRLPLGTFLRLKK